MNDKDGESVFTKYIASPEKEPPTKPELQKGPLLRPIVLSADRQSSPYEKLLDWLINFWPHDTVCTRDLYHHGPRPIRDNRKNAIAQAKILTENGWLSPIKSHRRDRKVWQIARGPVQRAFCSGRRYRTTRWPRNSAKNSQRAAQRAGPPNPPAR